MTLVDEIIVTNPDGTKHYEEGTDYEIDYGPDKIKRLPGGDIGDGGDVRVFYGKQILSSIIEQLDTYDAAILPRIKARIMKLSSPTQDPGLGDDITDNITSCRVEMSLNNPGEFMLQFNDADDYPDYSPEDGIFVHISAGLIVGGSCIFQPLLLGTVEERRIVENDGFHFLEITGRDLSSLLDFPKASASALAFNPSYKRQVFLNGVLISDDWRAERILGGTEALKIDDIVEVAYERVYPMCHEAIRAILAEAGWDTSSVSIEIPDFPLAGFEASGMSPLDALKSLAARVGAAVRAEGGTVIISSKKPPDETRTSWTYPSSVILTLNERDHDEQEYNAVQIFGHSETGLAPTRANLLPPIDPSKPGYVKLFEKEDTLNPEEPIRTDEPPQPFEMVFRIPAGTFDPDSLLVSGARLKESPARDGNEYEITLLVDWLFEDTAGEAPYIVDENGDKKFFLRGVVYDVVPVASSEFKPIPHARVERERIDVPAEPVEQTADDVGRYFFENVPQGIHKLVASHPDYLNNYEDNDPANDVERDLFEEEAAFDEAVENGRYIKYATDFHVIVWARPSTEAWGLSEHVIDQVCLEVRSRSVQTGKNLKYAPPVRDENITTQTLAAEIGRAIIAASSDARHPREAHLPLNPFLRAGDAIRVSGDEIDQQDTGGKLIIDRVMHHIDPSECEFASHVHSGEFDPSDLCRKHLANDPLDRINGVVVGITWDSQGVERCDVAAGGSVFRSIARSPGIPPVKTGDAVLIAKPSRNAVHYLVVARTSDIFGPDRIIYV